MSERTVERVVTAAEQREGAGFIVHRPFPAPGMEQVDPFLLLDEMGPVDYAPGEAAGAPDHPHRGFETVTLMLEGEFEHEDSAGHRGSLRPGDVQWMTAGAGIVHSEMPSRRIQEAGGRVHGFQIWVNLPAQAKKSRPRYQEKAAAGIPSARTADERATVRVIAGTALGVSAAIDTHTPIICHDWLLRPGADVTVDIPRSHNALLYVYDGALATGTPAQPASRGQMVLYGPGESVRLHGPESGGARALLLAGMPIRERIVRYGPFVMNTEQEIVEAIQDYRSGRMGEITRTARTS